MKTFSYRAVNKSGRVHKGQMSAANENELAFLLGEMDLELIEAQNKHASTPRWSNVHKNIPTKEKSALCLQLADMLSVGVPLNDALTALSDAAHNAPLRDVLLNVIKAVRAGHGLTEALRENTSFFDPVVLALVQAGETSGDLSSTFLRVAAHLEAEDKIKRDLRHALRYPLFLLVMAISVITFMMTLVVPQIVDFLASLDQNLPLSTRLLIGSAAFFSAVWWIPPILVAALWGVLVFARRVSPSTLIVTDRWFLNLPALGSIFKKLALSRLMMSLSLLIESGLTLPCAIETAIKTLGHASLEDHASAARKRMEEGAPLSSAFALLLPPHTQQMLTIGEASGHLGKALTQSSQAMEREARDAITTFLSLLEPALTLSVGAILAWIVLAVLGPVYASLGPLSQGM